MPLVASFRSPFRAPPLSLLAVEPLRAMFDGLAAHFACHRGATGDGHPVIVYPGLGAGVAQTALLRRYLRECGFAVHDWEGGITPARWGGCTTGAARWRTTWAACTRSTAAR